MKAKAEYVQCNGLTMQWTKKICPAASAHFALLVGVTTPKKFHFDEVHYVPATRQMLDPVMPAPMLNPMHPPLAKQLMALSIRTFADVPLG